MKTKAILLVLMLFFSMLVFIQTVSADSNYTELELTNYISCKVGERITVSLYVIPQTGTYIDTVATDEVLFTTSKLDFVGSGVTWGNLFQNAIFQLPGTVNEGGGKVTNIVWGTSIDDNTPGYMWNMTFDAVQAGYAYVNLTFSKVGVALDGNDKPKRIDSNCTIFIHEYIPEAPTGFSATGSSNSSIDLIWTKGTNADRTYIEYRETPGPWSRGAESIVYNGTGSNTVHNGLDPHKTYYYQAWSYNSTDNEFSTSYASDDGTTYNTEANAPTNEHPTHNSDYVSVYEKYMNVTVTDDDGDVMTVDFFWSNHTLIHSVVGVSSGGVASVDLPNHLPGASSQLVHNTDYYWYVNISDGYSTVTSSTYLYHTSMAPDINEDRHVNYLDVSLLVSHYGESVSPPGFKGWDINNDGNTNYLDVSALVSAYGDNY